MTVAVVVFAIADLEVTRVLLIIEGCAVFIIEDLVVIVVRVTGVAHGVPVVVFLLRVEVNLAVVIGVDDSVVVVVVIETVGHGVPIRIGEGVVRDAITVVIQAIADFLRGPVANADDFTVFTDWNTVTSPDFVGHRAGDTTGV